MTIEVRIAEQADVPAITAIYNQAIVARFQTADMTAVDEANRTAWLAAHAADRYPVFVAVVDNGVRGYCSLSAYRPGREALRHTAEISYYVDADYQCKGIGTALIAYAIEQAPKVNIKSLFAILLDANAHSAGLLEKFGFERWGHMPRVADFDGIEAGHLYYGMRVSE